MQKRKIWLGLAGLVLFVFAIRATFLWRDFVFVYDQGRDALAVRQILQGKPTLIGPTTGLFGVYLGPFFYYALLPFYLIGLGNPIVPAYSMVFLSALVVIPMFFLSKKIAGKKAGILAIIFYSFSFVQFLFSRWLSNPSPLPFVSLLLILTLLKAMQVRKEKWFVGVGLLLGICLQLEAANAVFLIPTLFCIYAIEYFLTNPRKRHFRNDLKLICFSLMGFAFMFIPQMLFELRHLFPTTRALITTLGRPSEVGALQNLPNRAKLLFDLYAAGWFWRAPWRQQALLITVVTSLCIFVANRAKLLGIQAFRVCAVWFLIPLIFHLLYTGNHGNFWDYYIIGQYAPLYILIAAVLASGINARGKLKLTSYVFTGFVVCVVMIPNVREWLGLFKPYQNRISLSLQLDAIDWVQRKAEGEPFGMWAYTPSYQDDVYKYLFWYKGRKNSQFPIEHPENTKKMFLVVEDDPGNVSRRQTWIEEMSVIGDTIASEKFGALTVYEVRRK